MIKENEILKIYGTDYKEMTKALLSASDLCALISKRSAFLSKAERCSVRIVIKPNLVCPSPASFGATTHPEVVAGIIEYLLEQGYENIRIAEGSWIGDRTADSFEYCGFRALTEEYGIPFVDTQLLTSHTVDCAGMELSVTDIVGDYDFLINVPVLKGHGQTKVTCALKNMKGLLPNTEKRHFHTMGLHRPIAHLSTLIHQDFIVVDHICGDPDLEDGGNPFIRNCIMASVDPVLTDCYAAGLLGIDPSDVPYIPMAASLGCGSMDLADARILKVVRDGLSSNSKPPFERDTEASIPHSPLDVSIAVDDADSCSACYANLVPALLRLKEEGLLNDLQDKIAIGQGHKKDTGRLGVGRCTKNYMTCIMGCPPDEEKIYRELKEYISSPSSHALSSTSSGE